MIVTDFKIDKDVGGMSFGEKAHPLDSMDSDAWQNKRNLTYSESRRGEEA